MLPCLFQVLCIYTDKHPLCMVAVVSVHVFESFPRRFQFSHAETNPTVNEHQSVSLSEGLRASSGAS